MTLWNSITGWLYKPFQEPLDPANWVLLILLSATICYGWSKVLHKVLED